MKISDYAIKVYPAYKPIPKKHRRKQKDIIKELKTFKKGIDKLDIVV